MEAEAGEPEVAHRQMIPGPRRGPRAAGVGGLHAGPAVSPSLVGFSLGAAILAAFVPRLLTFWLRLAPVLARVPALERSWERLRRAPVGAKGVRAGS